jgi:thiamine pyrophosphate-dependent acetolactate synthase large subunit-like protein
MRQFRNSLAKEAMKDTTRVGLSKHSIPALFFRSLPPRSFFHPVGFVSMGYSMPAVLGAKGAFRELHLEKRHLQLD